MSLWAARSSIQGLSQSILRTISTYSSIRYASAQNVVESDDGLNDDGDEDGLSFPMDLEKPSKSKQRRDRRKAAAERYENAGSNRVSLPALDPEKVVERKESLKVRHSLRKLLANAQEAGTPLDKALEGYIGSFKMSGFERAMVAIEPEFALPLFNWGKKQEGFCYKPRMVYTMMNALRRGDKLDEAKKLVQSLEDGVGAQLGYSALFMVYMNDDQQDKADEVLAEMKKRGIELHVSAYSRLLEIRFKQEGLDGLLALYKEHCEKNWMTDASGYNGLLTRLCIAKRTLEAYNIYLETTAKGVEHMEGTHQVLINGLLSINQVDDAFKVAEDMIKQGVKSRSTPFKRLINHLAFAGKYDNAIVVLREFLKLAPPHGMQLLPVLSAKNELDLAMEVVKELKAHDVKVDVGFKGLLLKLCDAKRVEDARQVFDVMVGAGVSPDAESCTALALCTK